MIKDPSPSTYLQVSFVASVCTIAVTCGVILLGQLYRGRPPAAAPKPVELLSCNAHVNVSSAGWIEIPAGRRARLRVPPAMHPGIDRRSSPPGATYWATGDGSLAIMLVNARRSDRFTRSRRPIEPRVTQSDALSFCPLDSLGRHAASIETSDFTSDSRAESFEVNAEIADGADSVMRVTVTANSRQAQRTGLAIVRSLRFIPSPPSS